MSDTHSIKMNTSDTPSKKRKLEKDNIQLKEEKLKAEIQARGNVIEFLVDNLKNERVLVNEICDNLEVLLFEANIKNIIRRCFFNRIIIKI